MLIVCLIFYLLSTILAELNYILKLHFLEILSELILHNENVNFCVI